MTEIDTLALQELREMLEEAVEVPDAVYPIAPLELDDRDARLILALMDERDARIEGAETQPALAPEVGRDDG